MATITKIHKSGLITKIHKSARGILSAINSDANVKSTVLVADTVHGYKFWIQQEVNGHITYRRDTTKSAVAKEWIAAFEDAYNEGEVIISEIDEKLVSWVRAL